MKYFALVDCNSFYASCERLFRPDLKGRPIVVLSNNDGCIVALSKEAKRVGIQMGSPYHQIKDQLLLHNVEVFSSNYALYQNISNRVMMTLHGFTNFIEVYSIDEAFLDLSNYPPDFDLFKYGHEIKTKIETNVGIPVCVGIARTKVLAKLANRVAKKSDKARGVVWLKDEQLEDIALKRVPIEDVWGIGRSLSVKLSIIGIKTAFDLKVHKNKSQIQTIGTKKLRQIQDELCGISCLEIVEAEKKKNIGSSRSFGKPIQSKEDLKEAVANYVSRAAEKMRSQKSRTPGITAYIRTNIFSDAPQYSNASFVRFQTPTLDTRKLIKAASDIIDEIYMAGYDYKKAGIELINLTNDGELQLSFLDEESEDSEPLMRIIDTINQKYGRDSVKFLACGVRNSWKMLSKMKSRSFTTDIKEIPLVE